MEHLFLNTSLALRFFPIQCGILLLLLVSSAFFLFKTQKGRTTADTSPPSSLAAPEVTPSVPEAVNPCPTFSPAPSPTADLHKLPVEKGPPLPPSVTPEFNTLMATREWVSNLEGSVPSEWRSELKPSPMRSSASRSSALAKGWPMDNSSLVNSRPPTAPPKKSDLPIPRCLWSQDNLPTTLRLRNLNSTDNSRTVVSLLKFVGISPKQFDFVYIPKDHYTGRSVGYGFVNFVNHTVFQEFIRIVESEEGIYSNKSNRRIFCDLAKVQGLDDLLIFFRWAKMKKNDMPLIFLDGKLQPRVDQPILKSGLLCPILPYSQGFRDSRQYDQIS